MPRSTATPGRDREDPTATGGDAKGIEESGSRWMWRPIRLGSGAMGLGSGGAGNPNLSAARVDGWGRSMDRSPMGLERGDAKVSCSEREMGKRRMGERRREKGVR